MQNHNMRKPDNMLAGNMLYFLSQAISILPSTATIIKEH